MLNVSSEDTNTASSMGKEKNEIKLLYVDVYFRFVVVSLRCHNENHIL